MRDTEPVSVEAVAHLDFNPKCDCEVVLRALGREWVLHRCCRQASWSIQLPCCGRQLFCCDSHSTIGWIKHECDSCGTRFDSARTWRWVRI